MRILLQHDVDGHNGVLVGRKLALALLVVKGQLLDFAFPLFAQHGTDGFEQRHHDVVEERVALYI